MVGWAEAVRVVLEHLPMPVLFSVVMPLQLVRAVLVGSRLTMEPIAHSAQ